MLERVRHAGPAIVVWAGVIACLLGLVLERMAAALPRAGSGDSLVLAAYALALVAVLRRWRGWAWANALALIWTAGMVFFAGPATLLATLLVAAAACALGSLPVPRDAAARGALALPVGLVLIGGAAGWLPPLPVFHLYLEWPLLAAICVWRAATLPASAPLAALAFAILSSPATGLLQAGAVLAAGLVALKLGHELVALILIPRARARRRIQRQHVPIALLFFVALAGSSYFCAWQVPR